jgi:hypothetical protein
MVEAEGFSGILWFKPGVRIEDFERVAKREFEIITDEDVDRLAREMFWKMVLSGKPKGLEETVLDVLRTERAKSWRDLARKDLEKVLDALRSPLVEMDIWESLRDIHVVTDWSEEGLVRLLEGAAGESGPFVRLLWEGFKLPTRRLPAADRLYKVHVLPRAALARLEEGGERLICFTSFQVFEMIWPERGRCRVGGGEVEVVFELEGTYLRRVVRRLDSRLYVEGGRGVLCPFTAVRVGGVAMEGRRAVVRLRGGSGSGLGEGVGKRGRGDECEEGYQRGMALLSEAAGGARARGLSLLREAGGDGHVESMYILGSRQVKMPGLDREKGLQWLRKAADQRHAGAMVCLSAALREGVGGKGRRVPWCRKAAELGHPGAMTHWGLMLAEGKGVMNDEVAAFEWYRKAAVFGVRAAMMRLADMWVDGKVPPTKRAVGQSWFDQATALGYVPGGARCVPDTNGETLEGDH